MDPHGTPAAGDGWFERARIVWWAMITAIGLYGAVLVLVTAGGGAGATVPQLRTALTVLAFGSGVASWLAHRRIVPRAPATAASGVPDDGEQQRRFGMAVLSWGFGETIALYGFVLALLERTPADALGFFALAALALVATRPRPALFR